MKEFTALIFSFLLAFLAIPQNGVAFQDTAIFDGFSFNLNNPGARAAGMGGAFTSLADDGTAMVTNPAGLWQIDRPEALLGEFKLNNEKGQYMDNDPNSFGASDDWIYKQKRKNISSYSFGSFLYPINPGKAVLGIFTHQLVNFKSYSQADSAIVQGYPAFQNIADLRKLDVRSYGVSGALKLTDTLSLGVSGKYDVLHYDMSNTFFDSSVSSSFSDRNNVIGSFASRGFDDDYTIVAGVLWTPTEKLHLGFSYMMGPEFDIQTPYLKGNAFPSGTPYYADNYPSTLFSLPDVWSMGVSYRFSEFCTVSIDGKYITYGSLDKGFAQIYESPGNPDRLNYKSRNIFEPHFGAEYVFMIGDTPLAPRLGYYYERSHGIKYTGEAAQDRKIWMGGYNRHFMSGGFGTVLFNHYQLDVAFKGSNRSDRELTVSMGYQF